MDFAQKKCQIYVGTNRKGVLIYFKGLFRVRTAVANAALDFSQRLQKAVLHLDLYMLHLQTGCVTFREVGAFEINAYVMNQ